VRPFGSEHDALVERRLEGSATLQEYRHNSDGEQNEPAKHLEDQANDHRVTTPESRIE
jgi:hypothetical protein